MSKNGIDISRNGRETIHCDVSLWKKWRKNAKKSIPYHQIPLIDQRENPRQNIITKLFQRVRKRKIIIYKSAFPSCFPQARLGWRALVCCLISREARKMVKKWENRLRPLPSAQLFFFKESLLGFLSFLFPQVFLIRKKNIPFSCPRARRSL